MIRTFVDKLRQIRETLEEFAEPYNPESWQQTDNGLVLGPYQPTFDPYAMAKAASLRTVADMLSLQGTPPSGEQLDYLQRALFGGMGSLRDFLIDQRLGPEAKRANQKLARLTAELQGEFQKLKSSG